MKETLVAGLRHEKRYVVPEDKTVPHVFADSPLFRDMPPVFATAFLVGLVEWACMETIAPHLDAAERSVGVDVRLTHSAATPVGLTVAVQVELVQVEGRRLSFRVQAHDGIDSVCEGTHDRFVILPERFLAKVTEKARR